jgi:hypothetical protein
MADVVDAELDAVARICELHVAKGLHNASSRSAGRCRVRVCRSPISAELLPLSDAASEAWHAQTGFLCRLARRLQFVRKIDARFDEENDNA